MKKLAAALLLIGICTPYSCDVRPVEFLWTVEWSELFFVGLPVLLTIAYALHALAPFFARALERRAEGIRWWLRLLYFGSVAGWLALGIVDVVDDYDKIDVGYLAKLFIAVLFSFALYLRGRRRSTHAGRIPLFALAIVGLPAVFEFLFEFGSLQYGAWIFTAGYVLAIAAELREKGDGPLYR